MFARDPPGRGHHSPPPSPRAYEKRKLHESLLRHRAIEAERRRRDELERLRRMHQQLHAEDERRRAEADAEWVEMEEEMARREWVGRCLSDTRDEPKSRTSLPPAAAGARHCRTVSESSCPPRIIVTVRSGEDRAPSSLHVNTNHHTARDTYEGSSHPSRKGDDEDEAPTTPHIMAADDVSDDDEEEEEDLESIWMIPLPDLGQSGHGSGKERARARQWKNHSALISKVVSCLLEVSYTDRL
ncbi:hypothetical protein ACHAXT_005067 [Thalassiosira profunda]